MNARYPIGQFEKPDFISKPELSGWIRIIAGFPAEIASEVLSLTAEKLDTPYRDGGWTVRQVVHHCADSHMNAFIRFKMALTETDPIIKPYYEAIWAELPDSKIRLEPSLNILKGLHERWTKLLESLFRTYRRLCYPTSFTCGTLVPIKTYLNGYHIKKFSFPNLKLSVALFKKARNNCLNIQPLTPSKPPPSPTAPAAFHKYVPNASGPFYGK